MHLTNEESLGGSDQLYQRAIESKAIGGSQLYNRQGDPYALNILAPRPKLAISHKFYRLAIPRVGYI